ncbi:hypothetical protein QNI19_11800 [Cytophagaceae bacterium DM2B3-1]|uniref:DUF7710 domain-containing protein n=1 Tax=Xanthocytophaga flava TaxID=3048013 RepID=A0ABT7CIR9_9BACT|nr:hypothetical protein [Xanthocytophaga flavus]MDJ1493618.1 hypothetical protein [Xanthocytophaga flavus]
MNNLLNEIWIFSGTSQHTSFPSGVFSSKEEAEKNIRKYKLSGVLTKYPVDILVYDWALEEGFLEIRRKDEQTTPKFIQSFSSAHLEHYHYQDGE